MLTHLAAPGAVPGITGGQIFGTVTLVAFAFCSWIALVLGVRGSDRIKINTRDKAGTWGIITGSLSIAAGGTLADITRGISSVPQSVLGSGTGIGNLGLGGTAIALTLITFGPRWKKTIWPALLGLSASVVYGMAGGIFGILINVIRMVPAFLGAK